jgi:ABC-type cobalamin/Fe3+-siderophores transport system ATPase subunit
VQGVREVLAVAGSTFAVDPGEVFGVMGPNGAGKTTTPKMLAGLVEPTAGSARVAGRDAGETAMREHLGWLPEASPLYEDMTARSSLRFFADLYDVDRETADERIAAALDRLDLQRRSAQLLYSLGTLALFGAAMLLPESPPNAVAKLAVGSPTDATYLVVAGAALAAAAGYAVARRSWRGPARPSSRRRDGDRRVDGRYCQVT